MSGVHHLDANVILRFLLADDPGQSPKAKELFDLAQAGRATLFISHVTLAEVSWVLLSLYGFERRALAETLRDLMLHDGVEVDDRSVMLDAFDRFGKVNVDFIDCYTAALAKERGCVVVTEVRDWRSRTNDSVVLWPDAAKFPKRQIDKKSGKISSAPPGARNAPRPRVEAPALG